ncbi:hypothetical protein [Cellulomonas sp. Root137]|uniref:hypothetical protein n=1 Tax=Cellulomonas sp. Root137 TaxID=1736459 RepID=UPI0006F77428|nr:hypothetical protein [Cellulomonas sp. Root137]KQY46569.1 hypothetical protein ASD18_03825 [Cellulomonas sp. Root137]
MRSARRSRLVSTREWVRLTRGVFDTTPGRDRRRDADHRRRRSAWIGLLAYGPDAIAVGPCALALLGVKGLPPHIAPEVAIRGGRSHRPRDGVRVRQFDCPTTSRYGAHAVVDLVAALVQALPELPREHAVAVVDDVIHRGLLSARGLADIRLLLRGRRRSVTVVGWLQLVDARAESPLETFARLRCVDAGIPPDELQVEIRARDGRLLGRGDLGWRLSEGRWLIAEIDGREFHEAPDALLRDRARQNALINSGQVELLRFTSDDATSRTVIPATVRAALTRDREARRSSTTSIER